MGKARPVRAPFDLLTPDEVAEVLELPRAEVLLWLETGRLPGLRVGRSWRVNPWLLYPYVLARLEEKLEGQG